MVINSVAFDHAVSLAHGGAPGRGHPEVGGVHSRPLTFTDLTLPVSPLEARDLVICHCADRNLNHLLQGFSEGVNNIARGRSRLDAQHSPCNTAQFSTEYSQELSYMAKNLVSSWKIYPQKKTSANVSDGVVRKEHFWIWKVLCPAHKYQESACSGCPLQCLHARLFLAMMEQTALF